jgi:hypothetical protein
MWGEVVSSHTTFGHVMLRAAKHLALLFLG